MINYGEYRQYFERAEKQVGYRERDMSGYAAEVIRFGAVKEGK
jgi:hypothetical protein